jgi:hypothetical protein
MPAQDAAPRKYAIVQHECNSVTGAAFRLLGHPEIWQFDVRIFAAAFGLFNEERQRWTPVPSVNRQSRTIQLDAGAT